jgi:hypothetical protein
MNKDDAVKALITDPVMQQRLAKHLVLKCFRNSILEDLHTGMVPDSKTGDYSDVVVLTPYGHGTTYSWDLTALICLGVPVSTQLRQRLLAGLTTKADADQLLTQVRRQEGH